MAIYIRCPGCKTDVKLDKENCPNCGGTLPKRDRLYQVIVKAKGRKATQLVQNSLAVAREIESKLKIELLEGLYIKRKAEAPTLDKVWAKYLEWYKSTGKAWQKEENRYRTLIAESLGNLSLDRITPLHINRLVVSMKNSTNKKGVPYSPKSIKNTVELVSRLFNYAIQNNMYSGINPCQKTKIPKAPLPIPKFLSHEEFRNLMEVLDNDPDLESANLIKFLAFTGLRRGEVFSLKWQDVDLEGQQLILRNPKGGLDQILPLNEHAMAVLHNQKGVRRLGTEFVFPSKGGKQRSDIKRYWARIKTLAGLPRDFRLHDLRHTYASLLVSSGVDLYTVQKLLTHKSHSMTQRYAHLADSTLRAGTRVLDKILEEDKGTVVRLPKSKRT